MSTAINSSGVLDADDLRDVDVRLLDYLREGRVTPAYARERLMSDDDSEYSRGYIQQRLSRLEEHSHATNCGGGLYELVDDPRGDVDQDDVKTKIKAAREHLETAVEAIDRGDPEELKRNTRDALAALEGDNDE